MSTSLHEDSAQHKGIFLPDHQLLSQPEENLSEQDLLFLLKHRLTREHPTVFEDAFAEEVWASTYKDHNDEDVSDTVFRVAAAAGAMEQTAELRLEWTEKFYMLLTKFHGTCGGRIYANAGTEWGGTTLMNCYVGPRVKTDPDSLDGIFEHVRSQAHTLKSEGGWGENFSYLRPRGAFIGGIGVETPGSVKYMEIFDKVSDVITAGSGRKSDNKKAKGKIRKGAMMGVLDCLGGNTPINTLLGKIPIKDLVGQTPYLYCADEQGKVFVRQALLVWSKGVRKTVKIVFDNDDFIECTPEHEFMLSGGAFKKAKDLQPSDSLAALNKRLVNDYLSLSVTGSRKLIAEHNAVFEMKYGYYPSILTGSRTPESTVAHHEDHVKWNNHPNNIQQMTLREHGIHHSTDLCELQRMRAERMKGKTWNEFYGEEQAQEIRTKYIAKRKGSTPWNKGMKFAVDQTNHKVVRVEEGIEQEVFDISMPDYHNFVANGVFVHNCWHPDIMEFITAKQHPGRLTKFNVSVNCTDDFMQRVVGILKIDNMLAEEMNFDQPNDERVQSLQAERAHLDKWQLVFPDTTFSKYKSEWQGDLNQWRTKGYPEIVYSTISTLQLWDLIMQSTYNRAEPGVLFLDRANQFLPLNYAETVYATNPCGEQTLAPGGVCNLGSLNLTQFINNDRSGFDLEKLTQYTQYMVRFLDNINDLTKAPLPQYEWSIKNKRRIGVGILGWGSALYMLKTKFASKQADRLRDEVMQTIAQTAYMYSIDLAEEKGMFSVCDPEKHLQGIFIRSLDLPAEYYAKLKQTGIRNSSLLSIQPTGNTSIFANVVSGGLEPVFLHEYVRTVIVGTMPTNIADVTPKWFEGAWHETAMFKFTKEGDEEILRGLGPDGVVYKIDKNRGLTKEVLCEDYGVRVMKRAGLWNSNAAWAATALSLNVKDHVSDLKGFARWVDSAMSKCVAEGTLLVTNRGIEPIEALGVCQNQEGFGVAADDVFVLDENGVQRRVTRHYYGGEKPCKTVRFDNGFELTATHTHKLKTQDGWKAFDELEEGDKVFYRMDTLQTGRQYCDAPQPVFAANAKHTTFPKTVDEDFGMLLGMWIADGSSTDHSISICEKNDVVEALCTDLMHKLFVTHKQQLDDRWGVRSHYVHSSSIARWFKQHFGHGAAGKRIPDWFLRSPPAVWKSFLEGLTLDGYIKKDDYSSVLVVYDGYSQDVATKVSYMLSAMGVQYSIMERNAGDGHKTFGVVAWLEDNDTLVPVEPHKRKYGVRGKTQNQTHVSEHLFEHLISQQPNNVYGATMRARLHKCQKRGNFVRMSFLDKLGVNYDNNLTCVVVTNIDDVGSRKVYDIEVEETHSYLINGIVSHNTVNVPNEYPFEDFKSIYIDSYTSGYVKGVTTYRAGTMTTVLAAKDEKTATDADEEIVLEDVKLPDSAPATMKTLKAEGRKWYLTVLWWDDQKSRPFGFFVHTNSYEKTVTSADAVEVLTTLARSKKIPMKHINETLEKIASDNNTTKVARMISLNLRHGVLIKNIVAALDRVQDVFVGTFLFQIKKYLSTFIRDGEKAEGIVCSDCQSPHVVFSEGCHKCTNCGSSKCG